MNLHALALALRLLTSSPDCVPPCPVLPGEELLRLGVGTQKVLTVPELKGTAVSGDAIDVRIIRGDQVLVIGASSGRGDLDVFTRGGVHRYVVKVTKLDPDSCGLSDVWKMLPCGGDFDFDSQSDRQKIVGTYRGLADLLQVLKVSAKYPGVLIPAPPPALVERAFTEVNGALFRAGLEVRAQCKGAEVELHVEKPQPLERVQQAAEFVAAHGELAQLCARTARP